MLASEQPDRIHVAFDDHRLVANAGLLLAVTLAQHLGLGELVDNHVDLGDAPGRANPGDKMLTLVASALAGGDCIDDADVLRTQRGNTPLWLELYWTENVPEGHSAWPLLDELEEKCPGQGMDKDGHVPIFVPKNSDQDPVVTGIVERLEQIGKLIDPDGPTYADAWKLS